MRERKTVVPSRLARQSNRYEHRRNIRPQRHERASGRSPEPHPAQNLVKDVRCFAEQAATTGAQAHILDFSDASVLVEQAGHDHVANAPAPLLASRHAGTVFRSRLPPYRVVVPGLSVRGQPGFLEVRRKPRHIATDPAAHDVYCPRCRDPATRCQTYKRVSGERSKPDSRQTADGDEVRRVRNQR